MSVCVCVCVLGGGVWGGECVLLLWQAIGLSDLHHATNRDLKIGVEAGMRGKNGQELFKS